MMHDLTNIQKTFNELIMSRLDDEILGRNNIGENEELIREELFEMKEIIEVPFGSIIYFLAMSSLFTLSPSYKEHLGHPVMLTSESLRN